MLNAVGREIPEEILERTGKEVFQGNNYKDGKAFQKASPKVTPVMRNDHDKMVKDIHEALVKCNAHDGMTVSFHHHFREGDLVVCMVMEEIHKMGFKNITLSASSLGKAHDALVPMIEDGTLRPARPMWTSPSSAHPPATSTATAPVWAARPTAAS
mgnify:CR=1 FL=1